MNPRWIAMWFYSNCTCLQLIRQEGWGKQINSSKCAVLLLQHTLCYLWSILLYLFLYIYTYYVLLIIYFLMMIYNKYRYIIVLLSLSLSDYVLLFAVQNTTHNSPDGPPRWGLWTRWGPTPGPREILKQKLEKKWEKINKYIFTYIYIYI